MLPISILLFLLSMAAGIGGSVTYVKTALMREKLTLYENSAFDLNTFKLGADEYLYMTIYNPITKESNYSLHIVATRHDGVEFPIQDNPIRLCELLSEEENGTKNFLTQLRLSRIFNMEGLTCPIPAGTKRLMPYMFPPKLNLHNDIGCGTFTYETTIQSCQGQKPENCMPFITASTDVFLSGDHCSNTLM